MRLDVTERQTRAASRAGMRRWLSLHLPTPTPRSQAQRSLPWRPLLLQATAAWFATRVAYLALTIFFPLVTGSVASADAISRAPVSLPSLLRGWTVWDGGWYIAIAQRGYWQVEPTAFFPLYPITIRVVETLIGPHWATAALIASNLSALLGFCGIALLAAQVAPLGQERDIAKIAVLLFGAYPLAFFLFAAYSDGLFAGLAAFTLLFAFRRRWGWAALFGFLTALCRPTAPALILPIAWEALQRYRERHAEVPMRQALVETAPALAACASPLAGIAAYSAWLWMRFGNPLIFINAESTWRHMPLSPILSVPLSIYAFAHISTGSAMQARVLLDLAPILVGIALTLVAARRAPLAFTLYLAALLYLITSEPLNYIDVFVSGGRYMIAAIPLFVIMAGWLKRSEWALYMLCYSGAFVQAILAIFFLRHGWMT